MEFINKIFEFELGSMVPEMGVVLDKVRFLVTLSVLIGPALLLILGLIYFFIPPKEANRKFGFRTYFGMGSVEAWKFTQKTAGAAFGGLGLVLLVIMLVVISGFDAMDHFQMVSKAMNCLLWQAALALLARLTIMAAATALFDKNGDRRQKKK